MIACMTASAVMIFKFELFPTSRLGSDVAGSTTENMFAAMAHAIQASKLRWRLLDSSLKPLTVPEAFYLATKGGGEFFGKVGSFELGFEMDAIVLNDSQLKHPQKLTVQQRLERMINCSDDRQIYAKYVVGKNCSNRGHLKHRSTLRKT